MSPFKPQLDKPKDGFGPCRFVALFSCPGVHTFTQFGRKTDGRYGIMPGGATAFLCTHGHASFSFHLHHLPTQRRSSIPANEGGGDPRRFQERVPYGLFVPDVRDCVHTLDGSESV